MAKSRNALNYWQKPERVAGFALADNWQVCYVPDYLDASGLKTWWSQVGDCMEKGFVIPVRWYHRLYSWFWYE